MMIELVPISLVSLRHCLVISLLFSFSLFSSQAVSQTGDISRELESNILGNIAVRKLRSMVIGVVDENGRRYYNYGEPLDGTSPWLNEHSVFPIGSISETFVGILLADAVLRGDVDLDSQVSSLLPGQVEPLESDNSITLRDIATHQPVSKRPVFLSEWIQLQSAETLYSYFIEPPSSRARQIEGMYFNLEFSALAMLLAQQSQTEYETMLNERFLMPLGLDDTKLQSFFFEDYFNAYDSRDVNLEGGHGIHSTANDMLTFIEANIGLGETPADIRAAMDYSHSEGVRNDAQQRGLSWYIDGDDEIEFYHDGTFVAGWRSQIRFSKSRKFGVVVLAQMLPSSTNAQYELNPIARHILDPEVELDDTGLNRQALPRNFVLAEYPEEILDKTLTGSVIVEVDVNLRGDVVRASVYESNLGENFEASALAAARKLKFNPRLENGRRVGESGVTYRFDF